MEALANQQLLPEAELDALVQAAEITPPFTQHLPATSISSQQSLGKRSPEVPEAVHAHLQEMANAGTLHPTTLQQRQRNRGTIGSEYGVPPELSEARRFGYISPNLPAPAGLIWRHRGGKWILLPRGG